MKINWFSPLPPTKTGIADYTLRILPSLQKYAEVVLWTNQSTWNSKIQQYAEVRHYQLEKMPWLDVNQADWNIYHIGNNCEFHSNIWQVSYQCPGLVILHDFKLHHFFGGFYKNLQRDKQDYLTQMRRYYGIEGERSANLFWNNTVTIEFMAENYPLSLLALENAVGVIVHNQQAYNDLKRENCCLIGYTPLPYISDFQLPQQENISQEPPYKLIIFGHIGSNRCLDVVLKALATFPEKNSFRLEIYGQLGDRDSISQQIQDLNLDSIVTLRGFVEEVELETALTNAHLAINLRYPTMGEASVSQLRIWSHALPSIVTQVGWYAQLPEDTVVFVRPEHAIEDIHQHLQSFLANPEQFIEMGKNGRRILEQQHNPEVYARAIVEFAQKAQNFRHCSISSRLIKRVGEQISLWSNSNLSDTTIKKAAEVIHFLCT